MKSMFRVALAAGVAAAAVSPAFASHSWGGYHWPKGAGELTVPVGDNVTAQWDAYLQVAVNGGGGKGSNAIGGWNDSTVIASPLVAGATNSKPCKAVSGRIEVCNANYGFNGWLGLASIWLSGGHIAQGTAKLNDSYFNSATYNTPAWRRLVMCQEIAHDYGLDHQDEAFGIVNLGTCMDYTNAPSGGVVNGFDYGPTNEYPNAHDYEELALVYNHVDSGAAAAVASAASRNFRDGGLSGETMAEWGRAIHRDRAGRPDMFVLDLGGGNRKLTHVYWAVGQGPRR